MSEQDTSAAAPADNAEGQAAVPAVADAGVDDHIYDISTLKSAFHRVTSASPPGADVLGVVTDFRF